MKKRISFLAFLVLAVSFLAINIANPVFAPKAYAEEGDSDTALWQTLYVDDLSGSDTTGNGSLDLPYKTLGEACDRAAASGCVIYLKSDVGISQLTVTKPVKIMSYGKNEDGSDKIYTISRSPSTSASLFLLEKTNSRLDLENVTVDGKNISKDAGALLSMTNAGARFNMYDGVTLTGGKSTNAAAVAQVVNGAFTMYGGIITGNESTVGIAAVAIFEDGTGNFFGGEITGNKTGGSYGALYVDKGTVNIGGDFKIYENTKGTTEINLKLLDSNKLNVVEDFTGEVHIYQDNGYYTEGKVFGNLTEGVQIFQGKFVNDRNNTLYGIKSGTTLIWGNIAAVRSNAKAELDNFLASISDPSDDIVLIINQAKEALDSATTIAQMQEIVNTADKKGAAITQLDTYLDTITNPSDAVIAIIDNAMQSITAGNYEDDDEIQSIIEGAELAINIQLAKEDVASQLNDYVVDPSAAVQAIIDTAVNSVDESNYEDIGEIIESAKASIDSAIAAQELAQAKTDSKTELDNYLADIENATEEMGQVVDAAKQEIDAAQTIASVEAIAAKAKEDIAVLVNRLYLNLWWLIILLIVIILGEAAVIGIKHYQKYDKKSEKLNAFLPLGVIVIPNGAYVIIAILAVIALALGFYIAYLYLGAFWRKNKNEEEKLTKEQTQEVPQNNKEDKPLKKQRAQKNEENTKAQTPQENSAAAKKEQPPKAQKPKESAPKSKK